MTSHSPFLDVRSFTEEEIPARMAESPARAGPGSPFLAVYELEEGTRLDSQTEEYVSFLNELYDEQFNEALSNLVDEAAAIYQTTFANEREDPHTVGYQAERLLDQHFAPLVAEAETMVRTLATELGQRDPNSLSEDEVETIVDRRESSTLESIAPGTCSWLSSMPSRVSTMMRGAISDLQNCVRTWGSKRREAMRTWPPCLQSTSPRSDFSTGRPVICWFWPGARASTIGIQSSSWIMLLLMMSIPLWWTPLGDFSTDLMPRASLDEHSCTTSPVETGGTFTRSTGPR
jgi:hypothetical protein